MAEYLGAVSLKCFSRETLSDRLPFRCEGEKHMKLRPRKREKRCYELSWRYLMEDERYKDGSWSLVQGELTSPLTGCPFGHAWLISDQDRVYDPVHDKEYCVADYQAEFSAVALTTYSRKEAAIVGAKHGHFGPWIWPPCGL
jgi:hypothetical protein